MDKVVTSQEVLYLFSISRETFRRWTEKGCPKIAKGKFDLRVVIQWRDKNILQFGTDEMAKARFRRELARARREELETAEKEGSLVSNATAFNWLIQLGVACRIAFMAMSKRLAPVIMSLKIFDETEIEQVIRTEVVRIIRILHDGRKGAEKMIRDGTFLTNDRRRKK